MHEIGHTLTFIHTDWPTGESWADNEWNPNSPGTVIQLPCTSSNDGSSVMNSSGNCVFTADDKKSIRHLYPDFFATPNGQYLFSFGSSQLKLENYRRTYPTRTSKTSTLQIRRKLIGRF